MITAVLILAAAQAPGSASYRIIRSGYPESKAT
jgi:hypothetical protein